MTRSLEQNTTELTELYARMNVLAEERKALLAPTNDELNAAYDVLYSDVTCVDDVLSPTELLLNVLGQVEDTRNGFTDEDEDEDEDAE